MVSNTFPIGAILFNFLFLMVAMALEAYVIYRRLNYGPKTSAFFAIAINLSSCVIGWLVFFFVEPRLSVNLKTELISYVFFNYVHFQSAGTSTLITLIGIVIFLGTFIVKYFGIIIFNLLLQDPAQKKDTPTPQPRDNMRRIYRGGSQNTAVFTTALIANAASYSAILGLVFLRMLG